MSAPRLAATACLLAVAMTVAAALIAALLQADSSYEELQTPLTILPDLAVPLAFSLVGGLVAVHRPDNLVGWSMLLSGLGWLAGGLIGGYGEFAVLAEPEADLPLGLEAVAISGSLWTPLMAGIFLLILLFPTGRVPSSKWRLVAPLVLLGFALVTVGLSTAPVEMGEINPAYQGFGENPLAFVNDERYLVPVYGLIVFCLAAILAAAIDLLFRFRRSRGEERQQYKWLVFAAGILAASIPFSGIAGFGVIADIADVTFTIGLLGLPVAVGTAVLKYRLYEIDRIINRTLTYGLLTAGLAAVYFGLVVALQALMQPVNGGSDFAIAITTLVVAAMFLPARRRIQAIVDRRFNRRQYDASRTVDAFSARLREQIDLDTLRYELLTVVDETMRPERIRLWLRDREGLR